ncbi:hypothetical protein [Silvimonas sp.]|uniref:trypsin-like serine peptidase n=1 Tax=Silvimonas sp. TaxID=2650811 RepID=UPI0028477899|nr:hypothetical protein [Silvimonas sp.]MDR3428789.1 hypothetical protein [Silvimonas sp.]
MKVFHSSLPTTLLNSTVDGRRWGKQYQLGLGVNAVTGQLRASAVKPITVVPSKIVDSTFKYALIKAESDLESTVSGSVKGAYNMEGVTVSASTSFLDELKVSELSVTLVATVSYEETEYSVADKYELAVVPGPDFRDKYGDYFVAGYRRAASLYAMYQCQFTSVEQRNKFSQTFAAEVPQVMTAEGAAAFEKATKECNATVNIRIRTTVAGMLPPPPEKGWTPDTVNSDLLPWFTKAAETGMQNIEACMRHYCMIDPAISAEVPIDPDVFYELSYLYNRFWLVRSMYGTCPKFGKSGVEQTYSKLESKIEANQAKLPLNTEMIGLLTKETEELLENLRQINNRQTFFTMVIEAAKAEPARNQRIDADKGTVRWTYGFQSSSLPGVSVTSASDHVEAKWKIGWNEHVFGYRDSNRVLVGCDVICNWADGTGGDWEKRCDQILGRSAGDVWVKSDYDRGYSWSIVWYSVDANLYPSGPWMEEGVDRADIVPGQQQEIGDLDALWTPERMQNALPVDRWSEAEEQYPDVPTSLAGGDANVSKYFYTDPAVDGPELVDAFTTSKVADPKTFPHLMVGKLFFVMGGIDRCGSAFVVSKNGIMTAAHCVLYKKEAASDIVFVPAYQAGNAPFGKWAIQQPFWPGAWPDNEEGDAYDLSFCTVHANSVGKGVGDAVGIVKLVYGAGSKIWTAMGYPANAIPSYPYDGKQQWQSMGDAMVCNLPSVQQMSGNLTQGSSGGPWFISGKEVNGLTSSGNADVSIPYLRGPVFGEWVRAMYSKVFD